MSAVVEVTPKLQGPLVTKIANRYGVDPDKMLHTLKATAFRGNVTNEQMMALCIVADQYKLNPFTKELFAFPDPNNGIVPVVSVDGWARIINERQELDGLEFNEAEDGSWIECVIYRKDRQHPTKVKEWLAECKRDTKPWKSHPRRMLRHKSLIQCARIAFGFGGIYDQDEAERIVEMPVEAFVVTGGTRASPRDGLPAVDEAALAKYYGDVVDILNWDKEETEKAEALREIEPHLQKFPELYDALVTKLKREKVITTKQAFYDLLKLGLDNREFHQ